MEPVIAVGLESTLDVVITYPSLEVLAEFSQNYSGGLESQVKEGYRQLERGSGGEVPIDGKREEAKRLLTRSEELGAEIGYFFGGNAAQEAVTLSRLGSESVFLGALFPSLFSKLSGEQKEILGEIDTEFVEMLEGYSPSSYILQAPDTNRYILAEGQGRRIDQLRSYLKKLPVLIEKVEQKYGRLNAVSLVGWQVLFGNKLTEKDSNLVSQVIKDIRSRTDAYLFTDTGGFSDLSKQEQNRLREIHFSFDAISTNEDEILQLSAGMKSREEDEIQLMLNVLKSKNFLSTIWLHTPEYQVTLTENLSRSCLETAQDFAALAGLYKVELGDYPGSRSLSEFREAHDFEQEGKNRIDSFYSKYGERVDGKRLVLTPCYAEERFISTVGAGDVSAATYLYYVAKQLMENS